MFKMEKGNEKISINKSTLWKSLTAILGLLLIIAIFTGGFGINQDTNNMEDTQKQDQPTRQAGEPQPSRLQVSADDDPVKGAENAPVTIIEFSDFQCSFCGRFFTQTLPSLEKEYIETGKVKLVYRDFPLSMHENAQKAAEAAECADEQGKFWEYHDKIFKNQNALDTASLKQYAEDLGLDTTKFNDCLDSNKMASEVQNDFSDGQSYGGSGTPTFFINGQKLVGAQPFSAFKQIIDAELNKQ